ncbi:MAG: efflux RND transporter periplasmic adaptor subunit [Planctomycetota bacterium]
MQTTTNQRTRTQERKDAGAPSGVSDLALDLVGVLLDGRQASESTQAATELLARRLGNAQVAFGEVDRSGVASLMSVSGVPSIDRGSERTRDMEAAMDEALYWEKAARWVRGDAAAECPRTLTQLAGQLGCEWIVSIGLRNSGEKTIGVCLAWGDDPGDCALADRTLQGVSEPFADAFATLRRADRGAARVALDTLSEKMNSRRKRRLALGAAIGLVLLAFAPVPYSVRCDCVAQPKVTRYVAAPFDATLSTAAAQCGDLVHEGQLLAVLDGNELEQELSVLEAEHARAKKAADSARAKRATAEAQLAALEAREIQLRIALLRDRLSQLRIVSPINGCVVSGDLSRVQGAPLETGQSLFEVAPLDRLVVEVLLPESEVGYATAGADTIVKFDAFPGRTWEGKLSRIHPQAELRGHEQVFVGELELDNQDHLLRPGMTGRARVRGPWATLSWSWFHQPMEKASRWWGW